MQFFWKKQFWVPQSFSFFFSPLLVINTRKLIEKHIYEVFFLRKIVLSLLWSNKKEKNNIFRTQNFMSFTFTNLFGWSFSKDMELWALKKINFFFIQFWKYSACDIQRNNFCLWEGRMAHFMLNMRQIFYFPVPSLSTQCIDGYTQAKSAYVMMN